MGAAAYAYQNPGDSNPYEINTRKRGEEDKTQKDKNPSNKKARTADRLKKSKAKSAEKNRYKKSDKITGVVEEMESTIGKP